MIDKINGIMIYLALLDPSSLFGFVWMKPCLGPEEVNSSDSKEGQVMTKLQNEMKCLWIV